MPYQGNPYITIASMGPSPFSDGNDHALPGQSLHHHRFNGAIAFQRWKWEHHVGGGPHRRRFNGAIAFQRWKCLSVRRKLRHDHRFNGAIAFQRWKSSKCLPTSRAATGVLLQWGHRLSAMEIVVPRPGRTGVGQASMGPSPFSDGNQRTHRQESAQSRGFNGAIAFQRWK